MAHFAFMINSAPGDPAPLSNNSEYASDLDDGGHEVSVFFDGQATQWIPVLDGDALGIAVEYYEDVRDRGLIGGARGYCASFFDVDDEITQAGIALDGSTEQRGPDVTRLANESYQLINVG